MKKIYTLLVLCGLITVPMMAQEGMTISNTGHVVVHANTYLGMEGNLKVSTAEGMIIKPEAFVTTKGNLSWPQPAGVL